MAVLKHIHLSDTLGSAPENAPNLKWTIVGRVPTAQFFVNINYTLEGEAILHATKKEGVPVRRRNFDLNLMLRPDLTYTVEEKVELVISLAAIPLFYVDSVHCLDGADHTPFVRNVAIVEIGEFKPGNSMLEFYTVLISLKSIGAT